MKFLLRIFGDTGYTYIVFGCDYLTVNGLIA
jgi:hypothetical protein